MSKSYSDGPSLLFQVEARGWVSVLPISLSLAMGHPLRGGLTSGGSSLQPQLIPSEQAAVSCW